MSVRNFLNGARVWAVVVLHILVWYSHQVHAQISIAKEIVKYLSPCQIVIFSEKRNGRLPQLAVEIMFQTATSEFPLESLELCVLFRKANYRLKHGQTCMVYLAFHPTPRETIHDKVDLLDPFFFLVADSYGWPEHEPG